MPDLKALGRLLDSAGLMARKQDGKIILYNRSQKFLSKGVLVDDLDKAALLVRQYVRYLQGTSFIPITDFASHHQYRAVDFKEVDNRVDEQSAYYINKSAMSSISRINLLLTAKALKNRVEASYSARVMSKGITQSDVRRYLKLKQTASFHLEGAEKVD
jgi:hypothetical protein